VGVVDVAAEQDRILRSINNSDKKLAKKLVKEYDLEVLL
jgi:hypothetical protein